MLFALITIGTRLDTVIPQRSKKALQDADLVLLVLNASEPVTEQDPAS